MSDLQPAGIPITLLDGVERHFLFTLSVVDKVQSHYDKSMIEVVRENLGDERKVYEAVQFITWALINDEIERNNRKPAEKADLVSYEETGWLIDTKTVSKVGAAILQAYGISSPKTDDEDDDPNRKSRSN